MAELDTPESLLEEALKCEDQSKYERDPRLIAYCLRNRDFYLAEAANLENEKAHV